METLQFLRRGGALREHQLNRNEISGYRWNSAAPEASHGYLLPAVLSTLKELRSDRPGVPSKIFDLGCGNGSVANVLAQQGWDVTGVDPSAEGVAQANTQFPHLKLYEGSAYDDLPRRYGQFPAVLSLEVVEHVYLPRYYAATLFGLVESAGIAIVSAPYHGYWKNLAMAVSGKMDAHFTALWDYGHIKFWSIRTLTELLREAGFVDIRFLRVGRIPAFAKSMIAIARKP